MKTLLLATTVALSLGGFAYAQNAETQNSSQLQAMAAQALEQNDVDVDATTLSSGQLTQIKTLVEEKGGQNIRSDLYVIVGTEYEPNYDPAVDNAIQKMNPNQLIIEAQETLREAGITYDASKLDNDQLAQLKTVSEENSEGDIDNKIWAVLGFENQPDIADPIGEALPNMEASERSQLEYVAYDVMMESGVLYDVNKLSNSQLVEIKNLTETDDSPSQSELNTIIGIDS